MQLNILVEQLGVHREQLTPEARLQEDLGADSLTIAEITLAHRSDTLGVDCTIDGILRRVDIRPAGPVLGHVVSQDHFTQFARTTVHQHNQLLLAQAKLLELASVQDFLRFFAAKGAFALHPATNNMYDT
jgi:hypothetical protein